MLMKHDIMVCTVTITAKTMFWNKHKQ